MTDDAIAHDWPDGKDSLAVEQDERAMLEAWVSKGDAVQAEYLLRRDELGYRHSVIAACWEAWQARASKGTK